MKLPLAKQVEDNPQIAWNDIEALPIYIAMALGFVCLGLGLLDWKLTLYATTIKVVGIMGSLALRHAWLKLDEEDPLF